MNYDEAMAYINALPKFAAHIGLDNISLLLKNLGDPQDRLQFVHVAGTNGKGSTVAFISGILMAAGYRVGIYTSPSIQRFSERIRINNEEIPDGDLARITTSVRSAAEKMISEGHDAPSEFEVVCALAFLWFLERGCDICVLEVGMGGRLDATNIIKAPLLAVITTISYDHMNYLGNTLGEIAFEKAGIIKADCDVLLYPQQAEAEEVFTKVCLERKARLHMARMPEKRTRADINGQEFVLEDYGTLAIKLLGSYQIYNAAMAADAALLLKERGFDTNAAAVRKGLAETVWAGRFEVLRRDPAVIVDGSHNAEGMEKLAESLELYFPGRKVRLILGILKDKQYGRMLDIILPHAERVFALTPPNSRALTAAELAAEISSRSTVPTVVCDSPEKAYRTAIADTGKDGIICACGSLYYIGQVRSIVV